MKVFISYAREDREIAERVWGDLKRAGIEAWIDRKELLPGQNWKTEISKAIRASSHFIALLSTRSVSKQGFFQTELKKAIDVLDTFPEHGIYFIPVRIDNCDPSYERLEEIHWADLFPSYEEGLSQILRVLAHGKSAPQIRKPRYQLRNVPITISDDELLNVCRLKESWFWLFRSPLEYIENDYKNNGDGTVSDHATGLMWQKSGSENFIEYEDVPLYIEELNATNFASYNDWRLPTLDELKSLLTQKKRSNGLYISPIFDKKQSWCCPSDRRAHSGVWIVDFNVRSINLGTSNNYVRAVRSIQ